MRDSYGSVGLHVGADFQAGCHTYPDSGHKPILSLDLGAVSVSLSATLSSTDHTVSEADVTRARRLAEAVTVYLAEMERLYSLSSTSAEPTQNPNGHNGASTIKPADCGRAA